MKTLYAMLFSLILASGAAAQDEFVPDPGQSAGEARQDDPEKELKDKIKKYDDLLKDAKRYEGPFRLFSKEKDGKLDLYLELPEDSFGKHWFMQSMLQSGVNADGLQAGEPANMDLAVGAFRFERAGQNVRLVAPNLAWRWSADNVWAPSSARSFHDALLSTQRIEAEHPEKKVVVIKITDFFNGGLMQLNERISRSAGRSYQYDRDNSGISEIKSFPENVVIRTRNFYTSSGGADPMAELLAQLLGGSKSHLADARSLPLNVTYLLFEKKETGYEPRLGDPRVGFFTQDYLDTTKPLAQDKTVRQVIRWDLRKKNPGEASSDPVKPIVFYLDDTVPPEYRKPVADGILRWNSAFEKIGITNAIEVKDKPSDADWDHADMRFNVVRFIRSENASYAVAWPRWDPFTGEVFNASISVDASIIYALGQEYTWIAAPAVGTYESDLARLVAKPQPQQRADGISTPHACRYGQTKATQAAHALTALEVLHPAIKLSRKEFIDQFLEDVMSHEMGHILGLRHNFVASTFLTPEQLADPKVTAREGLTASVMDYTPVNVFAVASGNGHYFSPVLGKYDFFAIEYGYKDIPGDMEAEKEELKRIASRASLPGLRFMTDENADSFDPYVVRMDNSSNPIADADKNVAVAKLLLSRADAHYPRAGRPYTDLTRVVNLAVTQTVMQSLTAARFIGGVQGSRNYAGDPQARATLAPIDPAAQRAALGMVSRNLFAEDAFVLSEKMLMNLVSDPQFEKYDPVPIKDIISGAQRMILSMLLSRQTVTQVTNNDFKWGSRKDRFTLTELYGTLARDIFAEVGSGSDVTPLRRELQRYLTDAFAQQAMAPAGSVDNDARMLALHHLKTLGGRLARAKSSHETTQIHLADLHNRVNKALNSVAQQGSGGGAPRGGLPGGGG